MTLFAVIWKDRHSDTTVHVFSQLDAAKDWALEKAHEYARDPEDIQETPISSVTRQAGWRYLVNYSCENDGLSVYEVKVDAEVKE